MILQSRARAHRSGFTLLELLTSMVVTSLIMIALFTMLKFVLDSWTHTSGNLRNNIEGRVAIEILKSDLESAVLRGKDGEWFRFEKETVNLEGQAVESLWLMFFSTSVDRDGDTGSVSATSYRIAYQDGITGDDSQYNIPALYRALLPSDETFNDAIGKDDLKTFWDSIDEFSRDPDNFLSSNVIQIGARLWYTDNKGTRDPTDDALTGRPVDHISISGGVITTTPSLPNLTMANLQHLDISISILDGTGARQIGINNWENLKRKHSRIYTSRIKLAVSGDLP